MKMPTLRRRFALAPLCAVVFAIGLSPSDASEPDNPILYVNQVPVTETDNTVVSIGGAHLASTKAAPRGGGLVIRYVDGTTKDLTRAANFGDTGLQGSNSIAVRDPQVFWDGTRALFSMVVGAPVNAADNSEFYWQIYEVTGLGKNDTPVITRVSDQPEGFNNIQPTYGSNGEIFFVSDRTLDGGRATYPARNEQGGESVTGIWKLEPGAQKLSLVDHSPSGSFKPFVDSFGRVVFSRWDHLQRDTTAVSSGAVDYTTEQEGADTTPWTDIFPETLDPAGTDTGHKFDLFLPWTVNQDGTGLLTMNHLGRHELGTNFKRSRTDSNLVDVNPAVNASAPISAPTRAGSYLQIAECPLNPGKYVATDAVSTAVSAGRFVSFTARPETNPDEVTVTVVNNAGLVRDPSFLTDGRLMGSFASGPVITGSYGGEFPGSVGGDFIPEVTNPFTIKVSTSAIDLSTGTSIVPPTTVSVSNLIDGTFRSFSGKLWQLQPVEVVVRTAPATRTETLEAPETKMFEQAGVSVTALKNWLRENDLALVVSRNVTSRDDADEQQPFSLTVPGGTGSKVGAGPHYEVSGIEFFQGDYVRGYTASGANERKGRRVTPRRMHSDGDANADSGVLGGTQIGTDGSMAMIVPASRALTWQLTDPQGESVVRERYWLSFSAGEIRLCANCHGQNKIDQVGRVTPTNSPKALKALLTDWTERHPEAEASVSPYEFWAEMNISYGAPSDADEDDDGLTNIEEFGYGSDPNAVQIAGGTSQPLRSDITEISGVAHIQVSFTRRVDGLRVIVEASTDLSAWSEVATIEGAAVATDGSVTVATSASAEQDAAGIGQVVVTDSQAITGGRSRYFRLRFVSE